MDTYLTSIGIANPKYRLEQTDLAEFMIKLLQLKHRKQTLLRAIYKASKINYRYSVLADFNRSPDEFDFFPKEINAPFPPTEKRMQVYKENALNLACAAVKNCLDSIKDFEKQTITHLITISCTGMYAPGIDIEMIKQLQLPTTIQRTAINFMGCYAVFNGIKVADAICKAEPNAKVLLVAVEISSIHLQQNSSTESIVSSALFADGAGAMLFQAEPSKGANMALASFHCEIAPDSDNEMAWSIGNAGFDIVLSSYVPQLIEQGILKLINTLLIKLSLAFKDIDYYAIHPGGAKILEACEKALNITPQQNSYSYAVLSNYGNMSSVTIIFVLQEIFKIITAKDNNKMILSCAFGPGLTLESMLLKVLYV